MPGIGLEICEMAFETWEFWENQNKFSVVKPMAALKVLTYVWKAGVSLIAFGQTLRHKNWSSEKREKKIWANRILFFDQFRVYAFLDPQVQA